MTIRNQRGSKHCDRKSQMKIVTVFVVVSLAVPALGWSQTVMTAPQHLALAQEYQEKANLEKRVLSGYVRERANKGGILGVFFTNNETPRFKEESWSYDNLIAQKKAEIIELNQLAAMHRDIAKELERK